MAEYGQIVDKYVSNDQMLVKIWDLKLYVERAGYDPPASTLKRDDYVTFNNHESGLVIDIHKIDPGAVPQELVLFR